MSIPIRTRRGKRRLVALRMCSVLAAGALPATDMKPLHAKIGELTLENES